MANIFLCHASEDKKIAKRIYHALISGNHEVFFDENNLSASEDYHPSISRAINKCDIFIFLITRNSLRPGKFTLTELNLIEKRWPKPEGKVLPINLENILPSEFPPYISTIVSYTIKGDPAAEVRTAVDNLPKKSIFSKLWMRAREKHRTLLLISISFFIALTTTLFAWQNLLKNNAIQYYKEKKFDLASKEFESAIAALPLSRHLSTKEIAELSAALNATKSIDNGLRMCQDYLAAGPGEHRKEIEKTIAKLWDDANKEYPYGVSHELECKK
jgi:hypothetical protein